MHFSVVVVVPASSSLEDMLADHQEDFDDEVSSPISWDWFVVGGRWSGLFDPDYDPRRDPANWALCSLCGGTGVRRDAVGVANDMPDRGYCNGCSPSREFTSKPGLTVRWPSTWGEGRGNNVPIGQAAAIVDDVADRICAVLLPDGTVITEDGDIAGAIKTAAATDEALRAVVVDCHV